MNNAGLQSEGFGRWNEPIRIIPTHQPPCDLPHQIQEIGPRRRFFTFQTIKMISKGIAWNGREIFAPQTFKILIIKISEFWWSTFPLFDWKGVDELELSCYHHNNISRLWTIAGCRNLLLYSDTPENLSSKSVILDICRQNHQNQGNLVFWKEYSEKSSDALTIVVKVSKF